MLSLSHGWVRHAVVDVAIELGGFTSLEEELDHLQRVALILSAVITLHAEVSKHKLWPFF